MCGIELVINSCSASTADTDGGEKDIRGPTQTVEDATPEWIRRRGPDGVGTALVVTESSTVRLRASVLSMRDNCVFSDGFQKQPIAVAPDCHLAWNGELYRISDGDTVVDTSARSIADTQMVAHWCRECLETTALSSSTSEIQSTLARRLGNIVDAEYAFVLVTRQAVYYGRDPWGRRSLVEQQNATAWRLASVADTTNTTDNNNNSQQEEDICWSEVTPGCIHMRLLETGETTSVPLQTPTTSMDQLEPNLQTAHELIPDPIANDVDCCWTPAEAQGVAELQYILLQAVRRRVTPGRPVTILFSGGLDSVLLAALAAQILDHVMLVNVDFVVSEEQASSSAVAADTQAALDSFAQLQALYPNTKLELIRHTATWDDIREEENRLRHLIHPKTSTMDLNIATALWFAAAAAAAAPADRILLTGLGADELFGGYTRHWKAYRDRGVDALWDELQLDQSRLWDRNLGRDDRVYSDTSHEARFPYLDASVTAWAAADRLPPEWCCRRMDENNDSSSNPTANKWILRQVALRMGLTAAAQATKRAIQFGSRMAHVSDKQRFGSRRKSRGKSTAPPT